MTEAIASQLTIADPYLVAFSPTNPRKRKGLDIDSLNDLAASIKAHGLAQPILVRPLPGERAADTFETREEGRPLPTYELVCGERRLRACRIAELEAIPMLVRDLSDDAALELQLVENIEREDLDPIEEAEGFELLRTKLGYTVEQIADRIGRGKGASYVRKSIKLLELTPESRQAMDDGHLGRSTALLVAHYPAAQQADVVHYIKNLAENGEPAPFRKVKPMVYTRFNLDLKKAVWMLDDATLVPAAGPCSACPKRSGAHADLFGETDEGPDSCADADCFAGKRAAHVERAKAQAQKDGFKVIDGEEAKAAMPSPYGRYMEGFVRLDSVAYTEKGDDEQERTVTFGDALRAMGKKAPKPRIFINPHTGEAVKVITDDLADKLQPKDEPNAPAAGTRRGRQEEQDDRPPELQALDDYQVRRAIVIRMFDAVRSRNRTDAEVLLLAKTLFAANDWELPNVSAYLNWEDDLEGVSYGDLEDLICGKLDALPPADVAAVATMAAIETALHTLGLGNQTILQLAETYAVDILAVRDKVAEDLERQESGDAGEEREEDEVEAATDPAVDEDQPPIATEPRAYVGARVRMKDDLRGPGGKFRKLSGKEGVLLSNPQGDDWMFKADGAKEKSRVSRDEFVVLAADGDADPDQVETENWPLPGGASTSTKLDPAAAWPFPRAE